MPQLYAIIAGVGPGTGAAIAKRFAKTYSVVLLGRTLANLKAVQNDIASDGGKAICIEADVSVRESTEDALRSVTKELGSEAYCAVSSCASNY